MKRISTGAALALSTAIAVLLAAPAAQAATNIGFDAHALGIGVSFEPGLPLSPASQQNALRAAKEYLDMTAYSHDGLIKQLEYEHYSAEDATYAADNVNADWNQQAAKAAKQYLDMTAYSHDSLVNQLEYEGYTATQAEYGVTAAGL
jgi:hypothetical protein